MSLGGIILISLVTVVIWKTELDTEIGNIVIVQLTYFCSMCDTNKF
jgi:hypothetical protein